MSFTTDCLGLLLMTENFTDVVHIFSFFLSSYPDSTNSDSAKSKVMSPHCLFVTEHTQYVTNGDTRSCLTVRLQIDILVTISSEVTAGKG